MDRVPIVFKLGFSSWRGPEKSLADTIAFAFRCPVCKADVHPQNVKCIVCPSCFHGGNTEHFSSVERRAA